MPWIQPSKVREPPEQRAGTLLESEPERSLRELQSLASLEPRRGTTIA